MKTRTSWVLAVFFLWAGSLLADTPNAPPHPLTLSECLQEAALNNPELKAAFEGWKAALEQIPQAKALPDPKFTYAYFIEEVETRVGPMENKFTLMQTFPWFGEIAAKTDTASAAANAAKANYEAVKLNLFEQVKRAYFEYSYLATAIQIAEENLQLLTHFEEVARTQYTTASARHPDIIRAQIELAVLDDVLQSLRELRSPTAAQVNALLNRPAESALPWPEKVPFHPVDLDRGEIVKTLIASNPELAAVKWQIEAAQSRVRLAKTAFYPNIGVGVDWTQVGGARMSGVRDSGKDAVALMFSLNIPLWRDSYKAGERQARANLRKSRLEKDNRENKLIARVFDVIYEIDDSRRKITLYGDTLLTQTETLVQATETAYTAGNEDFLSLIDAQRMLLKYRLDHERAAVDYQQRVAELEMLMGKELTP
jgi:outer membrane protein TolC